MCQRMRKWAARAKETWDLLWEEFWQLPLALMGAWAVAVLSLSVDTPPDLLSEGIERSVLAIPAAAVAWAVGYLSMLRNYLKT